MRRRTLCCGNTRRRSRRSSSSRRDRTGPRCCRREISPRSRRDVSPRCVAEMCRRDLTVAVVGAELASRARSVAASLVRRSISGVDGELQGGDVHGTQRPARAALAAPSDGDHVRAARPAAARDSGAEEGEAADARARRGRATTLCGTAGLGGVLGAQGGGRTLERAGGCDAFRPVPPGQESARPRGDTHAYFLFLFN